MNRRPTPLDAILTVDDPEPSALPKIVVLPPRPPRKPPRGMIECPPPGVYEGMSFDDYRQLDAINHSSLKWMAKSPEHFKDRWDDPSDQETDPLRFGISFHEAILEPAKLKGRIIPAPVHESGQYKGQHYGSTSKAWKDLAAANPGKIVLTPDELATVARMTERVNQHPLAGLMVKAPGLREVVIIWHDDTTGLLCKGRIDLVIPSVGRADLKSAKSASPQEFALAIVKHGYHTADAFYDSGVTTLRRQGLLNWAESSYLFAVETARPFVPGVYSLKAFPSKNEEGCPARMIDASALFFMGKAKIGEWLHKVNECRAVDIWPGFPATEWAQTVKAPGWYEKQFNDDEI